MASTWFNSSLTSIQMSLPTASAFGTSMDSRTRISKQRSIRIVPEPAPVVELLKEELPDIEQRSASIDPLSRDYAETSTMPILLGKEGKVRIAYKASGPYGLGEARLRYRLIPADIDRKEPEWCTYLLTPVHGSEALGSFDATTGAFRNSDLYHQVWFHKAASSNLEHVPDGLDGGGRFDFFTALFKHPDGRDLQKGDQIEFYVEVSNREPSTPASLPKWGQSETRIKRFGNQEDVKAQIVGDLNQQQKLMDLEKRQREIFAEPIEEPKGPETQVAGKLKAGPKELREGMLKLLAKNENVNPLGNQYSFNYRVENSSEWDIPLNDLKLRYWLTSDSTRQRQFDFYWGCTKGPGGQGQQTVAKEHVRMTFGKPEKGRFGEQYMEISFTENAPFIPASGVSEFNGSVHDPNWANFNRGNDYSFNPVKSNAYAEDAKITIYYRDKLVWGIEPGGKGVYALKQGEEEWKFGRSWLLVGPFPNPDEKGRDTPYPPEVEPYSANKEYDGLKGKVRWQLQTFIDDRIDLGKYFNHEDAGVAYARCWFHCGKKQGILATGSDDGIKVWLNCQQVLNKAVHRDAAPGDDKTPVELDEGWNELLLKIDNKALEWQFYLDLLDPQTGKTMKGIICTMSPHKQKGT